MRLIQLIILLVLVTNGSKPLLEDSYSELLGIELIATEDVAADDCEPDENETEGNESEDTEEDDMAAPDNHVLKEPKPNDISEPSCFPCTGAPIFIKSLPYCSAAPNLSKTERQAKISIGSKHGPIIQRVISGTLP